MRRLSHENERGAVAVLVAVLLVIVFAMAALVIEIGQLYWERRQLQNGADAAALALAAECADGSLVDCATATVPVLASFADPYADDNSHDAASAVPDVMPHGTSAGDCEPSGPDAANPLTDGASLVKVTTRTVDANNGNASFIPHFFAPLVADLLGQPGVDHTEVRACAVAGWGGVGGPINVLPLAICQDPHYNDLTSNGTVFGPPAQRIFFDAEECAFSTDTYPGGFGWLELGADAEVDTASGTCSVNVTEDQWLPARTGADTNNATYGECIEALYNHLQANGGEALVYVPIFSDYCSPNVAPCGSGEHMFYIEGFAGFMLSGYGFNGGPSYYRYPNASTCAGGSPPVCIEGYFTEFVTYDGFINNSAGDFGGTTVQLLN